MFWNIIIINWKITEIVKNVKYYYIEKYEKYGNGKILRKSDAQIFFKRLMKLYYPYFNNLTQFSV